MGPTFYILQSPPGFRGVSPPYFNGLAVILQLDSVIGRRSGTTRSADGVNDQRMRLSTIKLSGFKSFVDPTTLHLPTNMTGIVGPNGCGKSNIIDAVRWVLGESKASELRGESMQDVIFNGTTTRKPCSRASLELLFGNAGQRAGGQGSRGRSAPPPCARRRVHQRRHQ